MRKSIHMATTILTVSTLAISMVAVAAITGQLSIHSAFADNTNKDQKFKKWSPEGVDASASSSCVKKSDGGPGSCGGTNKDAREFCELFFSVEHCKNDH
jgi:hypothetical protein